MSELPQSVRATLWSYDIDKLSTKDNKDLIILQILNWGTLDAVHWMRATYSKVEIEETIAQSPATAWNKKSLSYWTKIYNVTPKLERITD